MGQIIRPNGSREQITPADGKEFSLKEMQEVVGGYIELVTLVPGELFMFVNEDGHALGLPLNLKATHLYHRAGGRPEYPVLGTVLVTSSKEVN
jgi:hypothetical protein